MNKPAVFKDDIVQCPECKLELYRILKDQYRGDIIEHAWFKGIDFIPDPAPGDFMRCHECGAEYCMGGKMYIKGNGWTP